MDKCIRPDHDSYGEDYDSCRQCFIRYNGPWEYNPWLEPFTKDNNSKTLAKKYEYVEPVLTGEYNDQ